MAEVRLLTGRPPTEAQEEQHIRTLMANQTVTLPAADQGVPAVLLRLAVQAERMVMPVEAAPGQGNPIIAHHAAEAAEPAASEEMASRIPQEEMVETVQPILLPEHLYITQAAAVVVLTQAAVTAGLAAAVTAEHTTAMVQTELQIRVAAAEELLPEMLPAPADQADQA